MNASQSYYGEEEEFTYSTGSQPARSGRTAPSSSRRAKNDSRRRKAPSQHNGIHRRRKKRITW